MTQNDLLDGETIISQSDNKNITLTNKRIRYQDIAFGRVHINGVMLENIGSIEAHHRSTPLLLIFGVIVVLAGVFATVASRGEDDILISSGISVFGLLLVILYFAWRKYLITIYSKGEGKINFEAKRMKKEAILDFINKVEKIDYLYMSPNLCQ
jgi:hypothetical protein